MYHNMSTINVEEVEVTNQKNKTNPGSVEVGRVSDIFDIFFLLLLSLPVVLPLVMEKLGTGKFLCDK